MSNEILIQISCCKTLKKHINVEITGITRLILNNAYDLNFLRRVIFFQINNSQKYFS
jgi:hypothetical protein